MADKMQYIQSITLDVFRDDHVVVNAKEEDNIIPCLRITIKANGQKITPPAGCAAKFRARKRDGTSVYNPATIEEGGTVMVELTEQTLAVHGEVYADVSLEQGDNRISTATFIIQVDKAPLGKNIASANELKVLTDATKEATEATAEAKRVTEEVSKAEQQRAQAEKGRVDAETARKTAESGRAGAESARSAAEKERAAAEGQRAAAEQTRSSAETTRQQQEQKRQTDTSKAISDANAATGRANAAAELVEGGIKTLLIEDQDDKKTWAASFVIKSGHLVMVADEKTA